MLTNEQRAHDLAVAVVTWQLEHIKETIPKEKLKPDKDGKVTAQVDVYKMYMHYYNSMLKPMQRDFPNMNEKDLAE